MERDKTIAIIGCGRMGGFLAKKLSNLYQVLAYDVNTNKARRLSSRCKTTVASKEELQKAGTIILALASEVVQEAIDQLTSQFHKDAILVNIATTLPRTDLQAKHTIISAKIIGHAVEMDFGEEPVIFIDGENLKAREKVVEIFDNLGTIVIGQESLVSQINITAAKYGILAALEIQDKLKELNLPEQIQTAAIRNVAAGTMKAFAIGDIGPFAQKLMEEYQSSK